MSDNNSPQDAPASPPRESANIMPGGMANTAGHRNEGQLPSFTDGLKSIKPNDFMEIHRKPCARDSLLAGLTAGAGLGGFVAVLNRPVWTACSWAVGSFCSATLVQWSWCRHQRKKEKEGMKRVIEVIDQKKTDLAAKREARRKAKDEMDRLEEERLKEAQRQKSWSYWAQKNFKFW